MEMVLLALLISVANISCFCLGANAGNKREQAESACLHPTESVMDQGSVRDEEEQTQRQEAFETMMHNIDVYDGTSAGQQDIKYGSR